MGRPVTQSDENRSSLKPLEDPTGKSPEGAETDPSISSTQEQRKISVGKEESPSLAGDNESRRRSSAKDGNKTDGSRANSSSGVIPGESSLQEPETAGEGEDENEYEDEDEEGEENMYWMGEEEDEIDESGEDSGSSFLKDITFEWQKEDENQNSTTGNDAEIQRLFGISTAIQDIENLLKGNDEGEEEEDANEEGIVPEESEPGPGPAAEIPQYPRKKTKEWLVYCDKTKNIGKSSVPKYTILLSPQPSIEDVATIKENYIPVKCNVSDPNHLETWGSIKALRGSTAQTTVFSSVPSRFTLQSAYCSKYNARCRQSATSFLSGSNSMRFDPRDEPIWQRGRHFTHPSDPTKRHFITVINTLNYDIKVMESTQSTPLQKVLDTYRNYNANIDNYRWTDVYEKPLDFSLTLHQNGLVDNSYITDEIGLDYYPVILLFFNDGFENDPPMQLDIRKAFVRDEVLLCRNYQLHGVPEPGEEGRQAEEEEEQQQEPEEKVTLISPLLRSRKSTISSNKEGRGGEQSQRSSGSAASSREARRRILSPQKKASIKVRQTSFEDDDAVKMKTELSGTSRHSGDSKKSYGSRRASFAMKEVGSSERRKTLDDVEQIDGSSAKKMSATEDKEEADNIVADVDVDTELKQLSNTEKKLSTDSTGSGKKKNSTDSDSIPPETEPEEQRDEEPSPENPESQDTEQKSSRKTSKKKTSNVSDQS